MEAYIISLLSTSLAIALVSILTPEGTAGGIAKHVRLLSSLLLLSILTVPIGNCIKELQKIANGDFSILGMEIPNENDVQNDLQATLDETSKRYVLQSLTQRLEEEFAIDTGDIRCVAVWENQDQKAVPIRVTVLLSGSAIWKDPKPIEAFVSNLLGCDCITALE